MGISIYLRLVAQGNYSRIGIARVGLRPSQSCTEKAFAFRKDTTTSVLKVADDFLSVKIIVRRATVSSGWLAKISHVEGNRRGVAVCTQL
jgi:hypothetical protein